MVAVETPLHLDLAACALAVPPDWGGAVCPPEDESSVLSGCSASQVGRQWCRGVQLRGRWAGGPPLDRHPRLKE